MKTHHIALSALIGWVLAVPLPSDATDWYWIEDAGGTWDQDFSGVTGWKDPIGKFGIPGAGDNAFLVLPYSFSRCPPGETWADGNCITQTVPVQYRSDTNPVLNQLVIESDNLLTQSASTPLAQLDLTSNVEIIGGSGLTFNPPPSPFPLPDPPGIFPSGRHVQEAGTNNIIQELRIGGIATSQGTYELRGGALTVAGIENVGVDGSGLVNQTGGTHSVKNDLNLGVVTGTGDYNMIDGVLTVENNLNLGLEQSVGDFNMSDGVLTVEGNENIGIGDGMAGHGNGVFIQTGGQHTVQGSLELGVESGSSGRYELRNATLEVQSGVTIGNRGTGTFEQSGGTHRIGTSTSFAELTVGNTGAGEYTMNAGLFDDALLEVFGNEIVGNSGSGVFTQNGGRHVISSQLSLGSGVGIQGTYTLNNSAVLEVNRLMVGQFGQGIFTQNDNSTVTVTDQLTIGELDSSVPFGSVYDLQSGELAVSGNVNVGRGHIGQFFQSGTATVDIGGDLILGNFSSAGGNYTLDSDFTGASWLSVNGNVIIGKSGTGFFVHDGGSHFVGGDLVLAEGAHTSGSYVFNGGTRLNVNGNVRIGVGGTALFQHNGTGSLHSVFGDMVLGELPGSHGTYENFGDVDVRGNMLVGTNIASQGTFIHERGTLDVFNFLLIGGATATGDFTQKAGTVHVSQQVHIRSAGSYRLLDGRLEAEDIRNESRLEHIGGEIVTGSSTLINDGEYILGGGPGTPVVNGRVVNNATTTVNSTTADFNGTFENNAVFESEAASSLFEDLVISAGGYLVGNAASIFSVEGDLINHSEQNTLWDTDLASLNLTGIGGQNIYLAGTDVGDILQGYVDNFSWGELHIDSGTTLNLFDGNATPGAGLYVGLFDLADGVDLNTLFISSITSDYNIYYNPLLAGNNYLGGMTFALNGTGFLTPSTIPVPPALYLFGSGILGLIVVARRRKQS